MRRIKNIESFDQAQDRHRTLTDTFGTSKECQIMKWDCRAALGMTEGISNPSTVLRTGIEHGISNDEGRIRRRAGDG